MKTTTKHITAIKQVPRVQITKPTDIVTIILIYDVDPYRMKSYGPLPLILIEQNKKLIDIQISTIKKHFENYEIVLCVNHSADKIYKYIKSNYKNLNIRIVENQLSEQSNSCENIRISLNNTMNSKILICNGALLLNDCIKLVDQYQTSILTESHPCESMDIGVNIDENSFAQHFSFGAKQPWSEILFLHNQENVDSLKRIITSKEINKNKFLFEILNDFISLNKVKCVSNKYKLTKINSIKTYHKIKDTL